MLTTESKKIAAKIAAVLDQKIIKMARGGDELGVASALTLRAGAVFHASRSPAAFDTFVACVLCENKRRASAGLDALPLPFRS